MSNRSREREVKKKIRELSTHIAASKNKNPIHYFNRGVAYTRIKEYNKAINDYSTAISLKPRYAKAFKNRARIYSELKKFEESIRDNSIAIELDPKLGAAFNNRGFSYYRLKQYKLASDDYLSVLYLNPDDEFAKKNLAMSRRKENEQGIVERRSEGPQIRVNSFEIISNDEIPKKLKNLQEVKTNSDSHTPIKMTLTIPRDINSEDDELFIENGEITFKKSSLEAVKVQGRFIDSTQLEVYAYIPQSTNFFGRLNLEIKFKSFRNREYLFRSNNVFEHLAYTKKEITEKGKQNTEKEKVISSEDQRELLQYDPSHARKIEEFTKDLEEDIHEISNASYSYRFNSMLDFNIRIDDQVFHDQGLTRMFVTKLDLKIRNKFLEESENIYVNLEKDKPLKEFLKESEKKYLEPWKIAKYEENEELSENKCKDIMISIAGEVAEFFGGFYSDIDENSKKKRRDLNSKYKTNYVKLGHMKKCGVCRHRSICFKLICDRIRIPCRIIRGSLCDDVADKNDSINFHVWNQVRILNKFFLVDTMNNKLVISDDQKIMNYHPRSSLVRSQEELISEKKLKKLLEKRVDGIKEIRIFKKEEEKFKELKKLRLQKQIQKQESEEEEEGEEEEEEEEEIFVTKETCGMVGEEKKRRRRSDTNFWMNIRHPNIIRPLCILGKKKGSIIRESMKSFKEVLKIWKKLLGNEVLSRSVIASEILYVLISVARGLRYLHGCGVIHSNLSMDNILLRIDDKTSRVLPDFFVGEEQKSLEKDLGVKISGLFFWKEIGLFSSNNEGTDISSFGKLMISNDIIVDLFSDFYNFKELGKKCVVEENNKPSIDEIIISLTEHLKYFNRVEQRRIKYLKGIMVGKDAIEKINMWEIICDCGEVVDIKNEDNEEEKVYHRCKKKRKKHDFNGFPLSMFHLQHSIVGKGIIDEKKIGTVIHKLTKDVWIEKECSCKECLVPKLDDVNTIVRLDPKVKNKIIFQTWKINCDCGEIVVVKNGEVYHACKQKTYKHNYSEEPISEFSLKHIIGGSNHHKIPNNNVWIDRKCNHCSRELDDGNTTIKFDPRRKKILFCSSNQ